MKVSPVLDRCIKILQMCEKSLYFIEAFNWRNHKRRNPIVFPHFIQSMLLAYIDSIEPLVASAHAQMQMKQANFYFFIFLLCNILLLKKYV